MQIFNSHSKIFLFVICFLLTVTNSIFAQGYICAIGGGSEDYGDWSDAPYSWIVQKSDSGKIIILSYDDASEWIPDYLKSFGAKEAYNKKIDSKAVADSQSTYDELITAKAIVLKGGDQWQYINLWKGTKTEQAIIQVFNNGGVIAGTSAGAAVLGDVDFSAKYGSVYPDEALRNPSMTRIDLEDNFLDLVPNVLFDTHFIERGRFGRLIPMLYKFKKDKGREILGIGIDDRTAFSISPDGIGVAMGSGAVAIYQIDGDTKLSEDSDGYLINNLKCDQLVAGWKFDLNSKTITEFTLTTRDVDLSGEMKFPNTNISLTGNDNFNSANQNNLQEFLNSVNSSSVLIISNIGNSPLANQIKTYLDNSSYSNNMLLVNSSSLDVLQNSDLVKNSTCFIFTTDSLNVITQLNDTSHVVSREFTQKIENKTPVFFLGFAGKAVGKNYVDGVKSDLYAAYRGKLTINEGLNIFSDLIFQPLIFEDSDYYESRTAALMYGMMRTRAKIGVYLNGTDVVNISADNNMISGKGTLPYIIFNSKGTTKIDSSVYHASNSIGPRQVVALNNLRISLTNNETLKYNLLNGLFESVTSVSENRSLPYKFKLDQNFPNPFNPQTNIRYSVEATGLVTIKVFDVLGREIRTLVNENKSPGNYVINFQGNDLSSGVYFYSITVNGKSLTKKMVLLK